MSGAALFAACAAASNPTSSTSAAPITAATITPTTLASEDARVLALARTFVFRVRNEACLGVGTSFESSGTVITNRHVAAGADQLDLATWDGTDFTAHVEGIDPNADLAELTASPPEPGSANLAQSDPPPGTPVWVAGYPEGDQLSVDDGQVTDEIPGSPFGMSGSVLRITNQVKPGNSGSPLLDGSGDVVGVVFALRKSDGEGLAIPVSTLHALLTSGPSRTQLPCAE